MTKSQNIKTNILTELVQNNNVYLILIPLYLHL